MIELECPECGDEMEFTFAADEDWAHRPCLEIDVIDKRCGCVLTLTQMEALCDEAIRREEDRDPPGDY